MRLLPTSMWRTLIIIRLSSLTQMASRCKRESLTTDQHGTWLTPITRTPLRMLLLTFTQLTQPSRWWMLMVRENSQWWMEDLRLAQHFPLVTLSSCRTDASQPMMPEAWATILMKKMPRGTVLGYQRPTTSNWSTRQDLPVTKDKFRSKDSPRSLNTFTTSMLPRPHLVNHQALLLNLPQPVLKATSISLPCLKKPTSFWSEWRILTLQSNLLTWLH